MFALSQHSPSSSAVIIVDCCCERNLRFALCFYSATGVKDCLPLLISMVEVSIRAQYS